MSLNKSKGNMFDWVDASWNTCKGKCPHGCHYCFMKKWGEQPKLHFDDSELKTNLEGGKTIFVGSSCDLWAFGIPYSWIEKTLQHCWRYDNTYLFQTKNPDRFDELEHLLPSRVILGTTIETNRIYPEMGNTPPPHERSERIMWFSHRDYKTTVTIEPVMDFDLDVMLNLIGTAKPNWVSIGANTNHKVKLPEPSPQKLNALIFHLEGFVPEVKIKSNLKRLLGG